MSGLRFGLLLALFALHGAAPLRAQSPTPTASPSSAPPAAAATDAEGASPSPTAERVAATARPAGRSGAVTLPPEKAQPVKVARFAKPPVIDGALDDEAWRQAAVLKDFYQVRPGDNIAPSKPTEVLLGYDDKSLYVAFRAYDEPGKVRATVAKRDQIFDDDYVGTFSDTYNAQRKAYKLFFNPLGV